MSSCIFCAIADNTKPDKIVYEDDMMIAVHDLHPNAPVHILLMPKKHITSLATQKEEDKQLLGEMMYRIKLLAEDLGIAAKGYRTVINTGKEGGQIINHLHIHVQGGKSFSH